MISQVIFDGALTITSGPAPGGPTLVTGPGGLIKRRIEYRFLTSQRSFLSLKHRC